MAIDVIDNFVRRDVKEKLKGVTVNKTELY